MRDDADQTIKDSDEKHHHDPSEPRAKINRDLQRQLLERLADAYPEPVSANELGENIKDSALNANVAYLEDHGLVEANFVASLNMGRQLIQVTITAQGIDFLADDGGLGAILGVVTIKVHEDTLKELIALKIQTANLPPQERKRFLDQLRDLPGDTTKHLVLKLVDVGLDNWQKALPILQSMMGPNSTV